MKTIKKVLFVCGLVGILAPVFPLLANDGDKVPVWKLSCDTDAGVCCSINVFTGQLGDCAPMP